MFLLVVVDLSGLSDLTMNPPFYRGAHQSRRKAVAHLCIVAVTSRLGSLGIFFFLLRLTGFGQMTAQQLIGEGPGWVNQDRR